MATTEVSPSRDMRGQIGAMLAFGGLGLLFIFSASPPGGYPVRVAEVASVALTDDAGGAALFQVDQLAPGRPVRGCLGVTYAGPASAGTIRLAATDISGPLAGSLRVVVEQGTGGGYGDCDGFVPLDPSADPIHAGPLAGLAGTTELPGKPTGWGPSPGAARTFRFTATVPDRDEYQGQAVTATFAWLLVSDGVPPPSDAPPSGAPTQPAPTTAAPTQPVPTTAVPTQPAPSTAAPTQPVPTTAAPTQPVPTQPVPTQPAPTTAAPTQPAPTTAAPVQPVPTTTAPTEAQPTAAPEIRPTEAAPAAPVPVEGEDTGEVGTAPGFDDAEPSVPPAAGQAPAPGAGSGQPAKDRPAKERVTTIREAAETEESERRGVGAAIRRVAKGAAAVAKRAVAVAQRAVEVAEQAADVAVKLTARTARHSGFPLASVGAMVVFLVAQDRFDRRDPKLALAPVLREPYLRFEDGNEGEAEDGPGGHRPTRGGRPAGRRRVTDKDGSGAAQRRAKHAEGGYGDGPADR